MERFTIDRLLKVKPNKYEVLVIAGKRAREIAQLIREGEIPEHVKPTIRALEELLEEAEGTAKSETGQDGETSEADSSDSQKDSK